MKVKASLLFLLCASLLLLPGSFAQKNKSSTPKPKTTPVKKATPTPAPTPTSTLAGTYTLIDPTAATDRVTKAIESAVDGMWAGEDEARRKLTETNLPPPQEITIWYSERDFSIKTDQTGLIQTPPDGKSQPWTSKHKDTYDVSTKWVNGNLERTFKSSRGRRVNTYSLSPDGRTLTMKVTAKTEGLLTPSFKRPFNYHLEYRRN